MYDSPPNHRTNDKLNMIKEKEEDEETQYAVNSKLGPFSCY